MKFLLISLLLQVSIVFAAPAVKCNIQNINDAEQCMSKVAASRPEYEEPNDGLATDNIAALVKVLNIIGLKDQIIAKAKKADFAGLMLEHGDEHHIYYFIMQKGTNVKPVELYDFNVVDLEYTLTKPYPADSLDPNTYFAGINCKDNDVYDDLVERIQYLKEEE